jgi:hypothetical protein
LIRGERGPFLIDNRDLLAHGFGAQATAVTDLKGDNVRRGGVQCDPDPLAVCFRAEKAPQLVDFRLRPAVNHGSGADWELDAAMLGSRLQPGVHKLSEATETDAHRTADPTERDSLQEEAFDRHARFFGNDRIFRRKNEDPATHLAAVILFARMDMTVSLIPY